MEILKIYAQNIPLIVLKKVEIHEDILPTECIQSKNKHIYHS